MRKRKDTDKRTGGHENSNGDTNGIGFESGGTKSDEAQIILICDSKIRVKVVDNVVKLKIDS